MPTRPAFAVVLVLLLLGSCHDEPSVPDDLSGVLTFESSRSGEKLAGWGGGPEATLSLDGLIVHGGQRAGRIQRASFAEGQFSSLSLQLPVTFAGETLELRGWLRTKDVTEFAALWLREDGPSGSVEFDNMRERNLSGTTEWAQYSIELPFNASARTIALGALLAGEGVVWVDDVELLVDGRPVQDVLDSAAVPCESDAVSGIEEVSLSATQTENLALLGKVWGFVKYHHPRVTAGQLDWDHELFRVMPSILEAKDRVSAGLLLSEWIAEFGEPEPCDPCAELPSDIHLAPDIDWIFDTDGLGESLSHRLVQIYRNRPAAQEHYYVQHIPGVGNPDFANEASYASPSLPDAGFRMLALFRFWNIIEYWYPYRDVMGEDWDSVLREFGPRVMAADSDSAYRLTMIEFAARINDTHANLWGELNLLPPRGAAQLPVIIRFIEGRAVVTGFSHPVLGRDTGLEVGDVIEEIDGRSVDSLVEAWGPFYPASNRPTRLRDIARTLTRGDAGPVRVAGVRSGTSFQVTAKRVPLGKLNLARDRTHDLPGETLQMLAEDVAYLKLSSVVASEAADYIQQADGAAALVVDIRNYPNEFVVFDLGEHLVKDATPFARFTHADSSNPGCFVMTEPISLEPAEPYYPGKIVILVDEVSQSQAEYTAMALRAAPNALVVGSTTAGADGNVSSVPLPGGVASMISGIGVFYPDGTPTQRVGIVPDVEVSPTIAGIRAGRDEVLEAGVSRALGREFRLAP